jgi:hypothetical protein
VIFFILVEIRYFKLKKSENFMSKLNRFLDFFQNAVQILSLPSNPSNFFKFPESLCKSLKNVLESWILSEIFDKIFNIIDIN